METLKHYKTPDHNNYIIFNEMLVGKIIAKVRLVM